MAGELKVYPNSKSSPNDAKVLTGTDCGVDKTGLDTFICGGAVGTTPSGLTTGGLVTEVTLSAVAWTALPASALADRNSLGVQNPTGTQIKINFATPAGYVGWIVNANGEFFIDITDSIILYARSAAGAPVVNVMEIA
jgi:hypothetical protein